jgi:outer membrane protein assembly factor BamC
MRLDQMKKQTLRHSRSSLMRTAALVTSVSMLSACSVLQEDKIDYKTAQRGNNLEVPPDLTQLSRQSRYALPSDVVSASDLGRQGASPTVTATAPAQLGMVTMERSGSQRWLVVNMPADQLWQPLKDYWKENGFELNLSDEALGIMETEWAENRAKIPQDFIRASIGRLFDGLYSTGERDKFRTRIERRADGGTEVYISHRGMQEVYTDSSEERTAWQPRAADPELEAEFLRRLMVRLGLTPEQASAVVQPTATVASTKLVQAQGQVWVDMSDSLDRAWRRVGLALDRTGFTVSDRNRNLGIYEVRYVPTIEEESSSGWFKGWFSSKPKAAQPTQFKVWVRSENGSTRLSVQNEQGQALNDANAQRILSLLVDDLK